MSILRDFKSLHISLRAAVLNVLSTTPFFFISIYLFKPKLMETIPGNPLIDVDFYFIIALCLGMGVLWHFMNFLLAIITETMVDWVKGASKETSVVDVEGGLVDKETTDEDILKERFAVTYVYSLGYISLAIFINYMWCEWRLSWFFVGCFAFIIFRILWILLWWLILWIIGLRHIIR